MGLARSGCCASRHAPSPCVVEGRPQRAVASTIQAAKKLVESQLEPDDWAGSATEFATIRDAGHLPVPCAGLPRVVSAAFAGEGQLGTAEPVLIQAELASACSAGTGDRGSGCCVGTAALQPEALADMFGDVPLQLKDTDDNGSAVTVPCAAFVKYLLAQDDTRPQATHLSCRGEVTTGSCSSGADPSQAEAAPAAPAALDLFTLCVFDADVLRPHHSSGMAALYHPPDVPSLGLRSRLLERLTPAALQPATRWLLLGAARSGTAMHVDPINTAAWNTVTHGVKRWALVAAGAPAELVQRERFCPPEMEWTLPEWFREEWPSIAQEAQSSGHRVLDFIQRAGETVCIPAGWWHAVVNIESSVAVTENYIRAETLQAAVDSCLLLEQHAPAASALPDGHTTPQDDGGGTHARQRVGDTGGGDSRRCREAVTGAVIAHLDFCPEDAEAIWLWLCGMHDDGILDLGVSYQT